jgi:hypothetical protein
VNTECKTGDTRGQLKKNKKKRKKNEKERKKLRP